MSTAHATAGDTKLEVAIRFDPARAREFESRLGAYIPRMTSTFGWSNESKVVHGGDGLCFMTWVIPSPDNLTLVEAFERETRPLPEWWVAMGELIQAERMELVTGGEHTLLMNTFDTLRS
ncbi:MAG TPA: hypothetical protein VNN80_00930 [Polyangiaceae bacterium]|nr:hypothetical protein [Polyangiaceae bacterium]